MLWIKAFHLIFMVTWFAGLFYLPRLYVYHAMSVDDTSIERFKIMERKLFFGIATPGLILTLIFGIWLLSLNAEAYFSQGWMHVKLALIAVLVVYHLICGKFLFDFKNNRNTHTHIYYRWFNEIPVILLVVIVILATVRPF